MYFFLIMHRILFQVVCGETSRKRSTGNMKVDVEIYFGTENTTITSVEYEKEVLTVTELMFVIENEFSLENVTLVRANHTTYLLGISSNGLEIECPDNAVPVYGNIISCSKYISIFFLLN